MLTLFQEQAKVSLYKPLLSLVLPKTLEIKSLLSTSVKQKQAGICQRVAVGARDEPPEECAEMAKGLCCLLECNMYGLSMHIFT